MDSELVIEVKSNDVEFGGNLALIDINELCRICGNNSDQLMPIFESDENEHCILHKIRKHLPMLKIMEDDTLPANVCYQCASIIVSWHELYHASKQVDERLRNICSKLCDGKSISDLPSEMDTLRDTTFECNEKVLDDDDYDNSLLIHNTCTSSKQSQVMNTYDLESKKFSNTEPAISNIIADRCYDAEKGKPNDDAVTTALSFATDFRDESLVSISVKCALCEIEINESDSVLFNDSRLCCSCYLEINASDSTTSPLTHLPDTYKHLLAFDDERNALILQCDKCDFSCPPILTVFEQHFQTHLALGSSLFKIDNNPSIQCATCNKFFLRKGSLITHLKNHERLTCKVCNCMFRSFALLKTHKKRHVRMSVNNTLIYCEVCKKYFKTRKGLIYHQEKICKPTQFKCYVCDESFAMHSMLQEHVKEKHDFVNRSQVVKDCTLLKSQGNETLMAACPICSKVITQAVLPRHLLMHSEEKPFTCDLCGKKFKRKHSLQDHIMIEMGMKNYVCDICGAKFLKQGYLNKHLRYHKLTNGEFQGFQCEVCGKRFPEKWRLGVHQRAVHKGGEFATCSCDICDQQFSERWMVRKHKYAEHNGEEFKEYKCDICRQNFQEKWLMRSHQKRAHREKMVKRYCDLCGKSDHITSDCTHRQLLREAKCQLCGESFASIFLLKDHVINEHNFNLKLESNSQNSLEVKVERDESVLCGELFTNKMNLIDDEQKDLCKKDKFVCPQCEKEFTAKYILTNHLMAHRKANIENSFKCEYCEKDFLTEEALVNHILPDKICLLCHKVYSCNDQLKQHVFTEHDDDDDKVVGEEGERFKCKICHKEFSRKSTMKNHLFAEMNLRRYTCEFCEKAYNYYSHLLEHLVTHHGKKEHMCSYCGKKFPTLKRFRDHVSLHLEDKPFHCDCGASFKLPRYLSKHKKHCKLENNYIKEELEAVDFPELV